MGRGLEWGVWYGASDMGGLEWGPGVVKNVSNPALFEWSHFIYKVFKLEPFCLSGGSIQGLDRG